MFKASAGEHPVSHPSEGPYVAKMRNRWLRGVWVFKVQAFRIWALPATLQGQIGARRVQVPKYYRLAIQNDPLFDP